MASLIDFPDPPWVGQYYDKYRNDFYGLVEVNDDRWAYCPEKCDFENCIEDCDRCPLANEDEEKIEMPPEALAVPPEAEKGLTERIAYDS